MQMYFILSLLFVLIAISPTTCRRGSGLFDQDRDQVLVLNSSNLDQFLNTSKSHSVVLFYSSICGHCQRFKQPYSDLATELQDMRRSVVFAAVNCYDDVNRDACTRHRIEGYPTTKVFAPGNSSNFEDLRGLQGKPDLSAMVSRVSEAVFDMSRFNLTLEGLKTLHSFLDKHNSNYVVMLEKSKSTWPSSLDVSTRNILAMLTVPFTGVKFRHVLFNNEDLTEVNDFLETVLRSPNKKWPLVLYMFYDPVLKKTIAQVVEEGTTDLQSYYSALKIHLMDFFRSGPTLNEVFTTGLSKSDVDQALDGLVDTKVVEVLKLRNSEVVYMEDLTSAVLYALSKEVPMAITFDEESLDALESFLTVLSKFFPLISREKYKDEMLISVSYTVRNLSLDLLSYVRAEKREISHESWSKALDTAFKKHSYKNQSLWDTRWVNCLGSQPNFRGYPCGIWTLFHTLQASAYSKDQFDTSVLQAMVKFINQFFSCLECRENFEKETEDHEMFLKNGKAAIKYLWNVHNSVNRRLKGDITEDPTHKKLQFPTPSQCPSCYIKGPLETDSGIQIDWNESKVFVFLQKFYSYTNIRFYYPEMSSQSNTGSDYQGKRHPKFLPGQALSVEKRGLFSYGDILFLVLVYALSMLCIGFLCCYFQRRKLQKCKFGSNARSKNSLV